MIEKGVSTHAPSSPSTASTSKAGDSTPKDVRPFMSLDGQLVSFQFRLMRAARAFLDIELQWAASLRTKRGACSARTWRSRTHDRAEVERYTFRGPVRRPFVLRHGGLRGSRAPSGDRASLGSSSSQRFHDFVLAQGLLPPELLREAVLRQFVTKSAASR